MPTAANSPQFTTVGHVRARLSEFGLDATRAEVARLTEIRDRAELSRALSSASSSSRAREYLAAALSEIRNPADDSPNASHDATPGSMPPPPHAHDEQGALPPIQRQQGSGSVTRFPSVIGHGRGAPQSDRTDSRSHRDPAHPASGGDGAPSPRRQRDYDQHVVYGRDTAVQFERSPMPDRDRTTANITMAKALKSSCKEGVNWQDAIRIMLAPHEVQLVAAVMLGYLPKVRFAGHGSANDKWFEVEEATGQYAGAVRVTVAQGRDANRDIRRVNVSAYDVAGVAGVLLRTASEQVRLEGQELLATIRRCADLHAKQQATRQASSGNGTTRT